MAESVKSDDSKEEFSVESVSDEGLSVSADGSELQEPDRAIENGGDQQKEEKPAKKGPVLGGATPEEASIEWPEMAAAVAEGTSVVSPPPPPPSGTKTVKTYYMVKIPRPLDSLSELKMTDVELGGKNEHVRNITKIIQTKKAERQQIITELAEPRSRLRVRLDALRQKVAERKEVLDELKKINEDAPVVNQDFFTSEKDLDERIAELEHRMQHNTMSLKEEKELVREIKRLEASRREVRANSVLKEGWHIYKDQKKALQEKLTPLHAEIDSLRKQKEAVEAEVKPREDRLNALTSEINELTDKKSVADKDVDGVRTQRNRLSDEERAKNMDFYQYKSESQKALELALAGKKDAVEQLCNAQVEKMMEIWNSDPEFRTDYVRKNISSTVRRLQTLDGRALGPNEAPVKLNSDKREPPVAKSEVKAIKEPTKEVAREPAKEAVKAVREPAKELPKINKKEESRGKQVEKSEELKEPEVSAEDKAALDAVRMEEEREHRRQIEMEKQKEAAARKKRQLEKKQAKEKLKLEKEQQRKEQERERKQRKKAAAESIDTTEVENIPPEEANGNHPQEEVMEEKKAPANTGVTRRGGLRQRPTNPIKLHLKKKNTLQRQLMDHWQIIVAALGVFIFVSLSAMIYVRA